MLTYILTVVTKTQDCAIQREPDEQAWVCTVGNASIGGVAVGEIYIGNILCRISHTKYPPV